MLSRALLLFLCLTTLACFSTPFMILAENGSHAYTGGTFSAGVASGREIAVRGVPLTGSKATLSFTCIIATYTAASSVDNWTCGSGLISVSSTDSSLGFSGYFTSGGMSLSGSGGGRGGHVAYTYAFNGSFIGTVSANGMRQIVSGSIAQMVTVSAPIGAASAPVTSGSFGWISGYSPVLVADGVRGAIYSADNIQGYNLSSYGTLGTGKGQFELISGLAEDTAGRIYASDALANRIIRIDNISGANWVELGSFGTGTGHFSSPSGIALDPSGKIWVADSSNNRVVRFDDISGKNWVSFGVAGSGVKEFNSPSAIAFDSQGRIYIADKGNNRIVRFDDISGKNWASFSQLIVGSYGYQVSAPTSVAVDQAGRIHVGLSTDYLLQADSIAGTSGSYTNPGKSISAVSVDKTGTIYSAGAFPGPLAQQADGSGVGYEASNLGGKLQRPTALLARGPAAPAPAAAVFTSSSLQLQTTTVGKDSATRSLYLANLGTQPLTIHSLLTQGAFSVTSNCPQVLTGGVFCQVSVVGKPAHSGAQSGALILSSSGIHPTLSVLLNITGTP